MKNILIVSIVIVLVAGFLIYWQASGPEAPKVTNFEECVATGSPVMESFPRQCRYDDMTFIEGEPSGSGLVDEPVDEPTGILPFKSGVKGRVLLGPTCPVVQYPLDPKCADKPYQTTVQVIAVGSPKSSTFATVESDENGNYMVFLPPGEFALQPVGGNMLPRCETKEVTIEPDVMLEIDLYCDSGIR